MAVNEKIITEVEKKTKDDPVTRQFLVDLLQYELESHGWYQKEYRQRIEAAVKEVKKDEV